MSKACSTPTTRRAFVQRSATALAVGAAVPAVIIPRAAQGTEPDPIFAMIEAHKAAVQRDAEAIKVVCATPNADMEAFEDAEDRRSRREKMHTNCRSHFSLLLRPRSRVLLPSYGTR